MKGIKFILALAALLVVACQQEVVVVEAPQFKSDGEVNLCCTRSYEEALEIAERAVAMLDESSTRSSQPRSIKRDEGQVVMRPVTRGSETNEEPVMYIFNNENDEGFTIVAADRAHPELIAVTELGNYTYGVPTGVEPFDLLMEDVAVRLSILPPVQPAFAFWRENVREYPYGPELKLQWGMEGFYGSYYPDGEAFDEATAIAQAVMYVTSDCDYTITETLNLNYGQIFPINKTAWTVHKRTDPTMIDNCASTTHNDIARFYYEIGCRLANGTSIALNNKLSAFTLDKTREVLQSLGVDVSSVRTYNGETIKPRYDRIWQSYKNDIFVFRGQVNNSLSLPEGGMYHTWIATRFKIVKYDYVEGISNGILDPSNPGETGYTETFRESREDYMLYMNWGYDGISNGWFLQGCFKMDEREDEGIVAGQTGTYNYNFRNIEYVTCYEFTGFDPVF